MDAGLLLQYLAIALAVAASVVVVARNRFPASVRRLRIACAIPLVREGRVAWLQRLGRLVAPAPLAGGDDGCGACNSCKP
jgi:hypothetical protein